jgi:hypothetical protein
VFDGLVCGARAALRRPAGRSGVVAAAAASRLSFSLSHRPTRSSKASLTPYPLSLSPSCSPPTGRPDRPAPAMSASASAEDGGAPPPASSSPQPFPGQQAASPSATTPPVTWHPAGSQPSSLTAAVRPSSEGKVGSASEVLKNGAAASSDDEGQLGQRGLSTGAGAAAASVPQPAGQGDGQPAASSAVKVCPVSSTFAS